MDRTSESLPLRLALFDSTPSTSTSRCASAARCGSASSRSMPSASVMAIATNAGRSRAASRPSSCSATARATRPAFVIDALAQVAEGKGRDDLLWPSESGGFLAPPSTNSWLSGAVDRCRKLDKTFPRVTAHDLRHTAASLAISAGANPKVVQRMLGHASAAMTLDVYADLFESDVDTVAENVAKMWPQRAASH